MIKWIFSCLLMMGLTAQAQMPRVPDQSFMPPNQLHRFDSVHRLSNMTEAQFGQLIDQAMAIYGPIVKAQGAELVIEKNWKDGTVNAYASQSGKTWTVAMFGGLARRPEVTLDGFSLVICHEIGHHLGGYVFKGSSWAASEGQSDYFATQTCAKMLWGNQQNINRTYARRFANEVPATVKSSCDSVWKDENARGWCYRTAMGGQSLANLLAALGSSKMPNFDTPDQTVVKKSDPNHPQAQCRLDTYFQGALCTKIHDPKVIPGKVGSSGSISKTAEMASAPFTCFKEDGFKLGYRPNCWFKSVR